MAKGPTRKVAFISSYPPRKCGIATFASDLIHSVKSAARGQFQPLVVAMRVDNDLKYSDPVKFEIRQNVKSDYVCAADYINFSNVDVVSVQHEFGLFGGSAGAYLNLLLSRLNAPIITTLHTILNEPEPDYYKSLVDVCNASYKVVVMNERGIGMLRDIYGVPEKKVELIAHGIPDLPFVDSNYYKHKFNMQGRRTILTFGLLSRNKGIEVMLRAMPAIIKADPSVLYIVLGMTHPLVLKDEGEAYRYKLQRIVKDLNLQEHVVFHNRFVNDEELHNFLCAADIYVTPYHNEQQLTSGTLSFAVGTGKAVVSSPYWAASELLADGRGRLVPFGDPENLAKEIAAILKNDSLFYSLRGEAYDYGRSRTWPKTGQLYWKMLNAKTLPIRTTIKTTASLAEMISGMQLPEPSLTHLKRLTDDSGLFQHAKYTIPDRRHGYTTDDNARALIVAAHYYYQYPEPEALRLFDTYLSFVLNAQGGDGAFKNFMNYDRTWRKNEPATDAFGRSLWALGTVMAKPPSPAYLSIVKDRFDRSVHLVPRQQPRSMAYAMLGMHEYLKQFPGASDIKRQLEIAADELVTQYNTSAVADWQWFEDVITYDNALLPHALFVAAAVFDNERYLEVARKTWDFLLNCTFDGDHFSFVGCNGWFERGKKRAAFDQQPIEAGGTVLMLRAAYDATAEAQFLTLQRKAFDWFLGENDLNTPVYDSRTKGCCDGLMAGGININQGAESMVSYLMALLAAIESYTILNRTRKLETAEVFPQSVETLQQKVKKLTSIKSIFSPKPGADKAEVEELT